MIVTCWYRSMDDGWEYNHYSQGFHPEHEEPAYLFESQRIAWATQMWLPRRAELVDGKIVNEWRLPLSDSAPTTEG